MEPPSRQSPASLFCRQGRGTPTRSTSSPREAEFSPPTPPCASPRPPEPHVCTHVRAAAGGSPENPEGQLSCHEPLRRLRGEPEAWSDCCITAAPGEGLGEEAEEARGPGGVGRSRGKALCRWAPSTQRSAPPALRTGVGQRSVSVRGPRCPGGAWDRAWHTGSRDSKSPQQTLPRARALFCSCLCGGCLLTGWMGGWVQGG